MSAPSKVSPSPPPPPSPPPSSSPTPTMDQKKEDPRLNFDSQQFDPKLVLEMPQSSLIIPVSRAPTFDNLAQYASRTWPKKPAEVDPIRRQQQEVREKMKQKFKEQTEAKQKEDEQESERNQRPSSVNIRRSVLDFMQQPKGPMCLLKEGHHSIVRVLIRRKRRVECPSEQFALIEGRLVLFDRHMNLVLYEAKENIQTTQSPSSIQDNGKGETKSKQEEEAEFRAETAKHKELPLLSRERFLNRVFIRGDSVVYVTHSNK